MANEVAGQGVTGLTAYFRLFNNINQVWRVDTTVFEAYTAANILNYGTVMTEQGASGRYVGTMPAAAAGALGVVCYYRAGASQAEADAPFAGGDVQWTGTAVTVMASPTNLTAGTIAAVSGAVGSVTGAVGSVTARVTANTDQWAGGTIPAVNVTGVPLVDNKYLLGTIYPTPTVAGIPNVNAKTWNDLTTVALPLAPATAGRTLVVDAAGLADANVVKLGPTGAGTAQTARDVGLSVLVSAGTGTGQIDLTSGVAKVNVTQLLGTAWLVPGVAGTPDVNAKLIGAVVPGSATIGTVTTVTNQLTAAAIATGVWTDTTASDFTTALSVGKSVMNGVALGTGLTVNAVTGLTASNLDAAVSSRMATYTQPTGFLAATFPTGTIANTTNITAGTITTVTTVTNQLTAAAIATGIWQDTVAGDFTVALSVGKSVMNGVALGTGLTVARCTLTDTLTTYTGNTLQTGDSFARIGVAGVGLTNVTVGGYAAGQDPATLVLAGVIEVGYTLKQTMQVVAAAVGGASTGGPGAPVYKGLAGSTRLNGAADVNGNRSGVVYTV